MLDRQFKLDQQEIAFFRRHTEYDRAEFLCCVGGHLGSLYGRLPARKKNKIKLKYEIGDDSRSNRLTSVLLENIEVIHSKGWMDLNEYYLSQLIRYRPLILLMDSFYSKLQANKKKDTPYPRATISRLLVEASV